jgi:hypothetical protein
MHIQATVSDLTNSYEWLFGSALMQSLEFDLPTSTKESIQACIQHLSGKRVMYLGLFLARNTPVVRVNIQE